MNDHLLSNLNAVQQQAVAAQPAHLLVIAGAGSGKTRVLAHRIAWLIQNEGVSPSEIFSVTFTNKAAATMRSRVESLVNASLGALWMGTFHSLSHRFLRLHWQEAGLGEGFQIIDQDDQLKLINQIHKNLVLDESRWPAKKSQWFINHNKDEGLRPAAIPISDNNPWTKTYKKVYEIYTEHCERSNLVDFAELLLRCYELLKNNPELLSHYQKRFRYLLVDEFQDTNAIQYAWLRLLVGQNSYVMAVGDDDQSIYSWRGARIDNMFSFTKDFANAQTIRLEQNYRSTGNILKAANTMIANNTGRLGKDLWTDENDGELISIYQAYNEGDEANFISEQIRSAVRQGQDYKDIAILYRSNAQSRVLEEILINANIPYRVYGGQKFFERSEIKDALAYLRLLVNRHDDSAFSRVINTPTRGIGDTTLTLIRQHAQSANLSLWNATQALLNSQTLASRAANFVAAFVELIDALDKQSRELPLEDQAQHILERSGLMESLVKDRTEKGLSRIENLAELTTAMQQFRSVHSGQQSESGNNLLSLYLSHIALNNSGEEHADNQEGTEQQVYVQLMTLHAAKGLEFPLVFLTGMEEGLFPHKMSSANPEQLEEERRLCYVGMTRAMQKLFITHAEQRYMYGNSTPQLPSRFIREIPEALVTEAEHSIQRYPNKEFYFSGSQESQAKTDWDAKGGSSGNTGGRAYGAGRRSDFSNDGSGGRWERKSASSAPRSSFTPKTDSEAGDTGLRIGQQVRHPKFGEGVVLNYEGKSIHARVQVKFAKEGMKWLILSYANLQEV